MKNQLKGLRIDIPYYYVLETKLKLQEKYFAKLQNQNNRLDQLIFLNNKLASILSNYVLLELCKGEKKNNLQENCLASTKKIYIINEVVTIVEKQEFVYVENRHRSANLIFIKFYDNFRNARVIDIISSEELIKIFTYDVSSNKIKIPTSYFKNV
ncbi:MAG: hypothetical protein FJY17_03210 [Bacteroidetes bacterium]|nr:hypothetical protein [Bacteroidota bacterium]